MVFDQAGTIVVPVTWYWCEPTATPLPFGSGLFGSRNWDKTGFEPLGPGDDRMSPVTYSKGELPFSAPGNGSWCGPDDWWLNGVPSDAPPITFDPWGVPECCPGARDIVSCVPFPLFVTPHYEVTELGTGIPWTVAGPSEFGCTAIDPSNPHVTVLVFAEGVACGPTPNSMECTWTDPEGFEVDLVPISTDADGATSVWVTAPGEYPPNDFQWKIVHTA